MAKEDWRKFVYRKVATRVWTDPDFLSLDEGSKLLTIYLLTSPQTNACGYYVLSIAAGAEAIGCAVETFAERFRNVCRTFRWGFDERTRVLWIRTWWKYNEPENPNTMVGNLKALSEVPENPLDAMFFGNISDFKANVRATFTQTFAERYPQRSGNQEQEQEQEQEQDVQSCAPSGADVAGDDSLRIKWPGKRQDTEIPAALVDAIPDFRDRWKRRMQNARNKPTPSAEADQLGDLVTVLSQHGAAAVIATVQDATRGGYQGIFPEKHCRNGAGRPGSAGASSKPAWRGDDSNLNDPSRKTADSKEW